MWDDDSDLPEDGSSQEWDQYRFNPGHTFPVTLTNAVNELHAAFKETCQPLVTRMDHWQQVIEEMKRVNDKIVTLLTYAPDRTVPDELYQEMRNCSLSLAVEFLEVFQYSCMENQRSADSAFDGILEEFRTAIDEKMKIIRRREDVLLDELFLARFGKTRPHTEN